MTFNSLYEIHSYWHSEAFTVVFTFNSLYEIRQPVNWQNPSKPRFQFSLWDSWQIIISIWQTKLSFNSLYEIHLNILSKNCNSSPFNSLYEIHLNYSKAKCLLEMPFNSLYEIRWCVCWNGCPNNPLSILFMRFNINSSTVTILN